jgi:diguanylate cyclase (GGDEF)-like protein
MGRDRSLLGSRVARRTLTAFVVACLIPLGVMAVLAFFQVGAALEKRALGDLEEASRSIGQQILDRLLLATGALEQLASPSGVSNAFVIDAAYLATAEGVRPLRGALDVVPGSEVAGGEKPRLFVRWIGGKAELLLAIRSNEGTLVGRVNGTYIWETADLLPYGLEFCAFAFGGVEPLFCTHDIPAGGMHTVLGSASDPEGGTFSWESPEGAYLASRWELFLPSRFTTRPWTIVVSQPRELALESLTAFNRVFLQALAVSIGIIVLLSMRQIRRILGPLAQLVAGTRQIARREFTTRVVLPGGDEFSELADSMNDMAKRLGQQFDVLTTLAEIDKLILSSLSIEEVFDVLVRRMSKIVPDCDLSMLLVDADGREHGRLYKAGLLQKPTDSEIKRVRISAEANAWLSGVAPCRRTTTAELGSYLSLELTGDATELAVLPLFRGTELRGALLARFPRTSGANDPEITLLGELAGRLSVAVGAVDREQELFNRAHFDPLTGLPNRRLCYDRLGQAITQAREDGHELAVLFVDLDGFKHVNDSLGHSLGDDLLRQTALRISANLRETDTLARLGGDEYVAILPHIHSTLEAEIFAGKIIESLKQPFVVGAHRTFVGASVGVTVYPEDGQTVEELLRKADTAMYSAKAEGRARCAFFSEDMDRRVHERLALQTDLRTALEEGQLRLHYQPEVSLQSRGAVCAEALLRWAHPTRGYVPPAVFIPVLEEIGLIERVETWVLETALTDLARWRAQGAQIDSVAVNIGAAQLFAQTFPRHVMGLLGRLGLKGSDLEIELTESRVAADFAKANETFRELRAGGVRVAIDDFGTGYSSLVYLHDLLFDSLKIDRAFVAGLPHRASIAIIEAVVTVARALGKRVVAEGVELEAQERLLKELGCDLGQGYLFARPADATQFLAWLRRDAPSDLEPEPATIGASQNTIAANGFSRDPVRNRG